MAAQALLTRQHVARNLCALKSCALSDAPPAHACTRLPGVQPSRPATIMSSYICSFSSAPSRASDPIGLPIWRPASCRRCGCGCGMHQLHLVAGICKTRWKGVWNNSKKHRWTSCRLDFPINQSYTSVIKKVKLQVKLTTVI